MKDSHLPPPSYYSHRTLLISESHYKGPGGNSPSRWLDRFWITIIFSRWYESEPMYPSSTFKHLLVSSPSHLMVICIYWGFSDWLITPIPFIDQHATIPVMIWTQPRFPILVSYLISSHDCYSLFICSSDPLHFHLLTIQYPSYLSSFITHFHINHTTSLFHS
jgi:hypothetical protein